MSIGQRDGLSRTAHFLCKVFTRLKAIDLVTDLAMPMPITPVEIADPLGLSPVHVNRMVKDLRDRRLVTLDGQSVAILDWSALASLGDFDPGFLHLDPGDRPGPP